MLRRSILNRDSLIQREKANNYVDCSRTDTDIYIHLQGELIALASERGKPGVTYLDSLSVAGTHLHQPPSSCSNEQSMLQQALCAFPVDRLLDVLVLADHQSARLVNLWIACLYTGSRGLAWPPGDSAPFRPTLSGAQQSSTLTNRLPSGAWLEYRDIDRSWTNQTGKC